MKALTVQQPWAWAITHGGKDVENRTQAWSYRGPLAIHAGQRWSERGEEFCSNQLAGVRFPGATWHHLMASGAFLGVVDLVDVHSCWDCAAGPEVWCSPWAEGGYVEHGGKTRRDIVHLVLENPRPLAEPIPCRGALGLWTPPADVLDQLQAVAR